jgi:ABC-type sulfate/molybdate transport systems ATPase subunit
LLDDVLAALDVHTAKWIVDKCFRGNLIRGRTVLLVTHNVALAAPMASFIVKLSSDGRISSQGSLDNILSETLLLQQPEKASMTLTSEDVVAATEKSSKGKLIVAEEISLGRVAWSAVKLYTDTLGGFVFWGVLVTAMIIAYILGVLEVWFLGYWATQYNGRDASSVPVVR